MATTVSHAADQAAGLLQNLTLESQPKTLEIPEPTKKPSANQFGSVDTVNAANGQSQLYDRPVTPLLSGYSDPSMCYVQNGYPYYYGGYNGTGNEWGDDYSRYLNPDGVEMAQGVYGENGAFMYGYHQPYAPYSPATSPVPTVGNDGQLYGTQHYPYAHYFPQMTPGTGQLTASQVNPPHGELSSAMAADRNALPVDASKGNSNSLSNGSLKSYTLSTPFKPSFQNAYNANNIYGTGVLPNGLSYPGYQDPRYGYDGRHSPISWLGGDNLHRPVASSGINHSYPKVNNIQASRSQNFRPNSHYVGLHHPAPVSGMGSAHGLLNKMYPSKFYGQQTSTYRSGTGFGSGLSDPRLNGRGWSAFDGKYRSKGSGGYFGYGNENVDGLNELNRGPRAKNAKNQKGFAPNGIAVKQPNGTVNEPSVEEDIDNVVVPGRELYNKPDFPDHYCDAKFFIIKSYSEDDVHKSIKYNVWASTPNGNKKLDAAYREATLKPSGCPIFLLFSVNTSGQFVGLAEMLGPVDFNKNVEYWQQDKWTGCFDVKWHIVKDVPNSLLKHITLENNENKPVTNSRDTQEVKLEQGLKVMKIFKDHSSRTCILDDFVFYEARQKTIQDKKIKQQVPYHKQVWEGKLGSDKKAEAVEAQKSLDTCIIQSNGNIKHSENAPLAAKSGNILNGSKPVLSEKIANGVVTNGC